MNSLTLNKMKFIFFLIYIFIFQFSFTQYSLKEIVHIVLENDFQLKIVENEVEIAKNENNIGNAGFLPTLSLNATQDFTLNNARQEFLSGQINEASGANNRAFNAGAVMEWTVFDGFKMFATSKKLDMLEEKAFINLRANVEMKTYEAGIAFYALNYYISLRKLIEESIALSKFRLEYLNKQVKFGAASKVQLVQAQLDLTRDSSEWIANEREIDFLNNQLKKMMRINLDDAIEVEHKTPKIKRDINWESTKSIAENKNVDLLLAKSEIAIQEQSKKEVISRFYPQIGLYGQYNFNTAQNEVGFLLSNRQYGPSAGIVLRWDILSDLSRYQERKNSKLLVENAKYNESFIKDEVITGLKDSYINYKWAVDNYHFEERNQNDITEIAEISKKSFESGALSLIELREVQFSLVEAERRFLETKLSYATAILNLSLVLGDFNIFELY